MSNRSMCSSVRKTVGAGIGLSVHSPLSLSLLAFLYLECYYKQDLIIDFIYKYFSVFSFPRIFI
jgi:hypothetical protein